MKPPKYQWDKLDFNEIIQLILFDMDTMIVNLNFLKIKTFYEGN